MMCPGSCAEFLCSDCKEAARDDKRGAAERDDLRAELTKATADAEAHRMRCASLETQLEAAKRAGLESDRQTVLRQNRIDILAPALLLIMCKLFHDEKACTFIRDTLIKAAELSP